MGNRHFTWAVLPLAVAMLSTIAFANSKSSTIASFKVIPVKCNFPNCPTSNHGSLKITYTNKTSKIIDNSGLVNTSSADHSICPQIAPDHKTIGWLLDQHMVMMSGHIERTIELSEAKSYKPSDTMENIAVFSTTLILYRDGHKLTKISGARPFIIKWLFLDKGKNVGVVSMGNHGSAYVEKYDTKTGKCIASFDENDEKLPKWAKELTK